MNATFNPLELQGNILRGYRFKRVRYLFLEVTDRAAARAFLKKSADGHGHDVPHIAREGHLHVRWAPHERPKSRFNIGLTFAGLKALGVPDVHLRSFPTEFSEGMARRAVKLGDVGDSAPDKWMKPFDTPERVHVIASVYANDDAELVRVAAQVAPAFTVLGHKDARALDEDRVFFGYVDSISQPRFHEAHAKQAMEPLDPLGTLLLGYPTRLEGVRFGIPTPEELGRDGTFNAFRIMAQDCWGFEKFLDRAADDLVTSGNAERLLAKDATWPAAQKWTYVEALREIVAAQLCGRWRSGTPYGSSPDNPTPGAEVSRTEYDYDRASRCPAGSHVRRANPRGGPIVQRIANYTRRLVRRGMCYGPDFDPRNPDDKERGLIGNFIGASLGAQFEAVMCDWLNLGLHDPSITGSNDPLLGANDAATSRFDMTMADGGTYRLHGVPRLITTRGGAYTFLPSLRAIRYLASLDS